MADGGDLQIEGLDALVRRFNALPDEARQAGMEGLEKGALSMIAEAKRNLRENTSVVTGMLRASGKVQKVTGDPEGLEAGFFEQSNGKRGYALYVEYGRKSGKFPPIDELAQWFYKKFHLRGKEGRKEAQRAGFLIARKIAKNGSRPHPFFVPAVEKTWSRIQSEVMRSINRVLAK